MYCSTTDIIDPTKLYSSLLCLTKYQENAKKYFDADGSNFEMKCFGDESFIVHIS